MAATQPAAAIKKAKTITVRRRMAGLLIFNMMPVNVTLQIRQVNRVFQAQLVGGIGFSSSRNAPSAVCPGNFIHVLDLRSGAESSAPSGRLARKSH
jgi:hypothetical protein